VADLRKVGRVDIEIIEHRAAKDDLGAIVPNAVRINGVEVLIPEGAKIQVGEISDSEPVTVTLTLFASSLTIRTEPDNR